jgi:hypothetical protein
MLRELRIIVAGKTHRRLRQVIRAEAEELSLFGYLIAVSAARGISIIVPIM